MLNTVLWNVVTSGYLLYILAIVVSEKRTIYFGVVEDHQEARLKIWYIFASTHGVIFFFFWLREPQMWTLIKLSKECET